MDILIEDFLQHLTLERGLAANSISAYRRDLVDFMRWAGKKDLNAITPVVVNGYFTHLSHLGRKPTTLARRISSLKHFFRYMQKSGRIKENPTLAYAAPKISRYHPDYLSPEQVKSIIEAVDPDSKSAARDRVVIELLYGCGLRLSELINLKPSEIEQEAGFVRVTGKGNKQRLVPLGQFASEAISAYVQVRPQIPNVGSNPLILNRFGKKFSRVGLWQIVKKLVRRANITRRVTPHTFRHSFATHLLEGGADLRIVQEMLGHADISTTEIYTQIDRDYIIAEHRKYHPREMAAIRDGEKTSGK